jgi:putative transposase
MKTESKSIVIQHLTSEELNKRIRELEKVVKKVNRLHFINQLYHSKTVKEACEILSIPIRTGYNWLKKWNEEGADGLNHQKGAGRPRLISYDDLKKINEYLKANKSLGTKDVY